MSERFTEEKYVAQTQMLQNRVKKRYQHLQKRFSAQNIEVFRLYDWDIPEIRAVVDFYAGHIVIGEYTRRQSTPEWLPRMAQAVAEAMNIPIEKVHLKNRIYGKSDGKRYERLSHTDEQIIVSERDLRFYVNLNDYVDTGLFSDHRNTRQMIREMAQGKDVLNLFCYTGSFTCCCAKGGAKSTVSVDRSETAISWLRKNMELNDIQGNSHRQFQVHAADFLSKGRRMEQRYDIAIVDPPSFYSRRVGDEAFDINNDHPELLKDVIALMKEDGIIFFSTNHQDFSPRMESLKVSSVNEITHRTIPEDYVNKRKLIHRCWRIDI